MKKNLVKIQNDALYQDGTIDKCSIFNLNYSSLTKDDTAQGLTGKNWTNSTKKCANFKFDLSSFDASYVTDVIFTEKMAKTFFDNSPFFPV